MACKMIEIWFCMNGKQKQNKNQMSEQKTDFTFDVYQMKITEENKQE